jgi:hypothetical protein
MRRVVTLWLLAALVVPATAAAIALAPGDGSLTVSNADGQVRLTLRAGVVLGRIAQGRLEVIAPDQDCEELLVWDSDDDFERPLRARDAVACVFISRDRSTAMRFRLVRGEADIRMVGRGLSLSAAGRGRTYLEGSVTKPRDGTFSVNGERPRSMPDKGAWFSVGAASSLP